MKRTKSRRHPAFTLVELLVVVAIIALLLGLTLPNVTSMLARAKSIKCAANLQSIGNAVALAAADNNNTYPEIDQGDPSVGPIYPQGSGATNIVGALEPYGITKETIKCPTDTAMGSASALTKYGSSYMWNPIYDDSTTTATLVRINGFIQIPMHSARIRLCTDFYPIHGSHNGHNVMNALYGDGHVTSR